MREPLLLPAVCVIAGSALGQVVPFTVYEALALFGALTVLALLARRAYAAWLFCISAGILCATFQAPGPPPEINATADEIVLLSGCVVEPSVFSDHREQFTLELDPGARARVTLALREGQTPPLLRYGQRVEFEGRVRKPRNFRNPGAFDFAGYLQRRHIYWTVSTRTGTEVTVLDGFCGHTAAAFLFQVRGWVLERLEWLYPGDTYKAWMMQALLVGENTRLEKAWTESFRRTGTYHALVISGIHITMVAGIVLTLLRNLSGRQTLSLLVTVLIAWLYAAVTGFTAPVLRAAAGFMLFSISRFCYRDPRILNFMALIAIAVLLVDPPQLFEASFQLSFLSVVAIAALADPLFEQNTRPVVRGMSELEDWREDLRKPFHIAAFRVEARLLAQTISLWTRIRMKWVCRCIGGVVAVSVWAAEVFLISCIMQVALALPMAFYFHRVSLSGMVANVLVVPLMNFAIVAGFAGVFTGWRWVAAVAGWLLDGAQWVAARCAAAEPNWRIPDPPLLLALAFAASLIALAVAARHSPRFRWVCFSLTMGLFALLVWHPFLPVHVPGQLEVTAIDVGQGDCVLIVTPEGRFVVVDGGGIPHFKGRPKPKLDIGEDVVSAYLWTRSIRRLDAVALTHAHEDHAAGLLALIENFQPAEMWIGAMGESPAWKRIQAKAIQHNVRIVPRWAGDNFVWGGADFHVLAPFPDMPPAATAHNNDSLVLQIALGRRSVLLTGDSEREVEQRLTETGTLRQADILKVGHHGSRTSTTEEFLRQVHPLFAIISAGQENLYRHPHPEVVQRLTEHRIGQLRTDQYGLIRILTDGYRLHIERTPWRREERSLIPPL